MEKKIIVILVMVLTLNGSSYSNFGGWSISKKLFDFIIHTAKNESKNKNPVVLELGSGWASGQLAQQVTLYSIEHDPRFLNLYPTHYIYAPIVNYGTYTWFDREIIQQRIAKIRYDLILIDGPQGHIGRNGFFENLHVFNTNVPLVFDDVHRNDEFRLLTRTAEKLGRSYTIYTDETGKQFGVILSDSSLLKDM